MKVKVLPLDDDIWITFFLNAFCIKHISSATIPKQEEPVFCPHALEALAYNIATKTILKTQEHLSHSLPSSQH